ncbi:Ca2 :cation antiporter [Globisporangium polare]
MRVRQMIGGAFAVTACCAEMLVLSSCIFPPSPRSTCSPLAATITTESAREDNEEFRTVADIVGATFVAAGSSVPEFLESLTDNVFAKSAETLDIGTITIALSALLTG